MSQVVSWIRQFSAQRTRRFWVGVGTGVLAVGAAGVALPLTAFASDAPQTVSGSASTKTGKSLTVTMNCPRGTTAVGVTGEIKGFKYATINELAPDGRKATARAFATQDVTEPWSLNAKALCVHKTSDIEYVSQTSTLTTNQGGFGIGTNCPNGKELIGLGWSIDAKARIAIVMPWTAIPPASTDNPGYSGTGYPSTGYPSTGYPSTGYPSTGYPSTGYPSTGYPSTGYPSTGYPGTGTGSTGEGGNSSTDYVNSVVIRSTVPTEDWTVPLPAWKQTGIAVCATPGHGTYNIHTRDDSSPTGTNRISTSCAANSHINAVGLWMWHYGKEGQVLRRLAIEPGGVMGTFESINLSPTTADNSIEALCAVS